MLHWYQSTTTAVLACRQARKEFELTICMKMALSRDRDHKTPALRLPCFPIEELIGCFPLVSIAHGNRQGFGRCWKVRTHPVHLDIVIQLVQFAIMSCCPFICIMVLLRPGKVLGRLSRLCYLVWNRLLFLFFERLRWLCVESAYYFWNALEVSGVRGRLKISLPDY